MSSASVAPGTSSPAREASNKLTLLPLVALVVGSMIGAGVFNLPKDMSSGAWPGAIILGRVVTGIGMLMLAFVYQNLAVRKPQLNAGLYATRGRFGDYRLQLRLGLLDQRLPRQRRLCGGHLQRAVVFRAGFREWQQRHLRDWRLDLSVAGPHSRAEGRTGRGVDQRRHHDSKAGTAVPVYLGRPSSPSTMTSSRSTFGAAPACPAPPTSAALSARLRARCW